MIKAQDNSNEIPSNSSNIATENSQEIIQKLQGLEENAYNIIDVVEKLKQNSVKFQTESIENVKNLQEFLLQCGSEITNPFQEKTNELEDQKYFEQIGDLFGYINELFRIEITRVNAINNQTEFIDIIKNKVVLTLSEICNKSNEYQDALERCESEYLVNIYKRFIEINENAALSNTCVPVLYLNILFCLSNYLYANVFQFQQFLLNLLYQFNYILQLLLYLHIGIPESN